MPNLQNTIAAAYGWRFITTKKNVITAPIFLQKDIPHRGADEGCKIKKTT